MFNIIGKIRGDKTIWAIVFLLALISFLPVYSASTNLVYVVGKGTTIGYLFKHFIHVMFGFLIIFLIHLFSRKRIVYSYIAKLVSCLTWQVALLAMTTICLLL